MKKEFQIKIPDPCTEDWDKMSPNSKGRFCTSCTKTVVDFSGKTNEEIQAYISRHQNENICGRFKNNQLENLTLEVPSSIFQKKSILRKSFALALLLVMGSSILSCKSTNGLKRNIDKVTLIESKTSESLTNKQEIKTEEKKYYLLGHIRTHKRNRLKGIKEINIDSLLKIEDFDINQIVEIEEQEEIIENVPTIEEFYRMNNLKNYDLYNNPFNVQVQDEFIIGLVIETQARFRETKDLTEVKAKEYFDKHIRNLFTYHLKVPESSSNLKPGIYKLLVSFKIDKKGNSKEYYVLGANKSLEEAVKKVLQKLPKFIPASQLGKPVDTKYSLLINVRVK